MTLKTRSIFDKKSNTWTVDVIGEIDVYTAKELKEELIRIYNEKQANITLNLDQLNYIDSTGLGVIIGTYGRMKENGNEISLIHPKQNILKLLTITGLDKIFIK